MSHNTNPYQRLVIYNFDGAIAAASKPLADKPAAIVSAVAGHGVERALETMERFVSFAEMDLVGKLGVAAGMGDVRELEGPMEEARGLGAKIRQALNR